MTGALWVVDATTNTVASTIALPVGETFGGLNKLVASPDGSRVYVVVHQGDSDGSVYIIDTATATIVGDPIAVPRRRRVLWCAAC